MDESLEELASKEFDLAPDHAELRIGQVLSGRYRIDAVLSKGGLGTVYRGEHVHMRKQIAIKVLHPETKNHPHLAQRFEREAIAGAHIHHANVASAMDFGQLDDGAFFLITEFVPGRPLHELIRAGRLSQRRAALIARQIAEGLAASHDVGIAHRDLKPANVMIVENADDLVKLIDFGFARIDFNRLSLPDSGTPGKPPPPSLTTGTMIFGTPAYMAPETVGGMSAVDYRSDLYALGVIAFEMLTGERPFEEPQVVRLLRRKNQERAPTLSERLGANVVATELESLVARLLERMPEDRFASAHEVAEALGAAVEKLPEALPPRAASSAQIEFGPTQEISVPSGDHALAGGTPGSGPARGLSSRRSWTWIAAIAAFGVAGMGAIAVFGRGAGLKRTQADGDWPSAALSESAAVVSAASNGPAPPAVEVKSAASLAASAEPASSSDEPSRPDRTNELRAEMWKGYAQKRWKPGAEALLALVAEDPSVFQQPDMVPVAASLAVGVDNVDAPLAGQVIDALGASNEAGSVDVLYQIVRTTGATRRSGKRALGWLKRDEVLQRATPAARVAIELRLAGCAQKRPLFQKAAVDGDERALAELQALYAMRCGRRKPGPCCFKRDAALSEALTAMSSRLQKK